ncbi:hypothetical protein SAMN02745831_02854 [Streptomyces sp. PgraA7]|nr:hypothetical protein SAMN02745831_02854 [Streptomyces sp. PgraA7]
MDRLRNPQVSVRPAAEPGIPCAISRMLRDFPAYFGHESAGKWQS